MTDSIHITNGAVVSGPPCHVCGTPCARWERIDPFGKSDRMRPVCDDHAMSMGLVPQIFPMPRPAGFFATLTPEQQARALAYTGPDSHGDSAFAINPATVQS